jgi:hypothetical protein
MCMNLRSAIEDILTMPYYKNEHARSGGAHFGHEAAVAERLKNAGFSEILREKYPGLSKTLLKRWAETGNDTDLHLATVGMPVGSYILQPAGSQNFPDILLRDFNGRFVAIECKSGKTGRAPMWNDNLPKPNTIYILSSGKENATTVFMGRDVMTADMLASQQQMVDELKKIVLKYKTINEQLDVFHRGWSIKFRPQNFQGGGLKKTNYFTHTDRSVCEKNVLEFSAL